MCCAKKEVSAPSGGGAGSGTHDLSTIPDIIRKGLSLIESHRMHQQAGVCLPKRVLLKKH